MKLEVQGSGDSIYEVDTELITCTCPNFRYRCRHFGITNPDRMCKHIFKVFNDHPELKPAAIIQAEKKLPKAGEDADGKVRYPRAIFDPYVSEIRSVMAAFSIVSKYEFCGSYRRLASRVSDLDVLIVLDPSTKSPDVIFDYCENILNYSRLWRGQKKASYKIDGYIQVDFKIVPIESWVFSLCHYTGSKGENIRLRRRANDKGLTLNEYGIYRGEEFVGNDIKTEEDLYSFLELPYKTPYERSI